jgi:hypothetical protein
MQNAAILNIRLPPDSNRSRIAPHHGVKPDAGLFFDRHIADYYDASSDKCTGVNQLRPELDLVRHGVPVHYKVYAIGRHHRIEAGRRRT